jgi:hypothetical protein
MSLCLLCSTYSFVLLDGFDLIIFAEIFSNFQRRLLIRLPFTYEIICPFLISIFYFNYLQEFLRLWFRDNCDPYKDEVSKYFNIDLTFKIFLKFF